MSTMNKLADLLEAERGPMTRVEVMTGYNKLVKMSRSQRLVRIPLLVVLSQTPVITVHLRRTPGPGCSRQHSERYE